MEELNEYLGNLGQFIGGKEVWSIMQKWRETFAFRLKEETDKWTIDEIDWHVFSYGYFPYLTGRNAETRFEYRNAEGFYVISSGELFKNKALFFAPSFNRPKENLSCFVSIHPEYYDLYFLGQAFDWTMIYTHEPTFEKIYAEI